MKAALILLGLLSVFACASAKTDKVVCYFGSWANYRTGNGKFNVEDISTTLCTHIIYSFVGLNTDGTVKILDTWNEINLKGITRFIDLKKQNPNLVLLMAIGGWNEGSTTYSSVTNDASRRAVLVSSIVNFINQYGFDGFDLDWEYPAQRGGAASDRQSYISLIKDLRAEFDKRGWLLTAAVAAASNYHATSYDVPKMSQYLDFINIMAYDLHGAYEYRTGQNAPLYASKLDTTAADKLLNVDAAIQGWINSGADPAKLILGMGTYGKTFTLSSSTNNGLGAAAVNTGNGGPYSQEPGLLTYLEICENLKNGWTRVWDDVQKVPYTYKGNQWVGYDDVESLRIKSQYAIDKGLGGAMIWAIDYEDKSNVCGGGEYPLLQAINDVLFGTSGTTAKPTTTTTSSGTTDTTTTTTKATTTTVSSGSGSICTKQGYVRDALNCAVFYNCQLSAGVLYPYKFTCQTGLYFDTKASSCNWSYLVTDC